MNILYIHASKYGNGAAVADEFRRQMGDQGIAVDVRHVNDVKPKEIPAADLYVFSSPGRFGRPIGNMRRFLKKAEFPGGGRYSLIVTEFNPDAEAPPAPGEEPGKCQRVLPYLDEKLQAKGLVKVTQDKFFVTGLKGPLESGWQEKLAGVVSRVLAGYQSRVQEVSPVCN